MTSLPTYIRLTSGEVRDVFSSGKRQSWDGIGILYKKNGLLVSRFAVVVSLKVAQTNVKRNRLRRQTKDVIVHMLPEFKKGYDIVIVFRMFFKTKRDIEKVFIEASKRHPLLFSR